MCLTALHSEGPHARRAEGAKGARPVVMEGRGEWGGGGAGGYD